MSLKNNSQSWTNCWTSLLSSHRRRTWKLQLLSNYVQGYLLHADEPLMGMGACKRLRWIIDHTSRVKPHLPTHDSHPPRDMHPCRARGHDPVIFHGKSAAQQHHFASSWPSQHRQRRRQQQQQEEKAALMQAWFILTVVSSDLKAHSTNRWGGCCRVALSNHAPALMAASDWTVCPCNHWC